MDHRRRRLLVQRQRKNRLQGNWRSGRARPRRTCRTPGSPGRTGRAGSCRRYRRNWQLLQAQRKRILRPLRFNGQTYRRQHRHPLACWRQWLNSCIQRQQAHFLRCRRRRGRQGWNQPRRSCRFARIHSYQHHRLRLSHNRLALLLLRHILCWG